MQGDARVIELLNETLRNELTAINQYWLHYRLLDHWGVCRLAALERKESIEEMEHADRLIARILFLGGRPKVQAQAPMRIGDTVDGVLRADLELEREAIEQLRSAIAHSESVMDFISRDLFAKILEAEEGHVDMLEQQLELMERIGLPNYVQMNSRPAME